ncbi:MAG: hypothetical protein QOE36_3017 [Gaiellaceae bacterium]|nr:hypothetical protein [Gaiellaceae bacterium]
MVALAVYALLLAAAGLAIWRRPALLLPLLVVGLAFHNAVMAALFAGGVRGADLTAIQAWKEALLGVALARVAADAVRARRLPFRPGLVDWLALGFAAIVVLYALLPQGPLEGHAGAKAIAYGLRHDLVPVGAYLVGRSVLLGREELRRFAWTLLATAAAVGALGIAADYALSLDWWRDAHVAAYFRDQLGFHYRGPRGLPENFVYNTGNEHRLLRRLVSVFLSPLGTSAMLLVALVGAAAGLPFKRRPQLAGALAAVVAVALLLTFTRSALAALALALIVLALLQRRLLPLAGALATIAAAAVLVAVFPSIAPRDHFTKAELVVQRENARKHGGAGNPVLEDPSAHSHLSSLREGLRTVVHHPQGFGLGNAGQTASRTGTELKAGESTYTELGVETGLLGMLLFIGWMLVLVVRTGRAALVRQPPWTAAIAAALAAVLALAVQTDVLGEPWLAYCVFWLAGSAVSAAAMRPAGAGSPTDPAPAVPPASPPAALPPR